MKLRSDQTIHERVTILEEALAQCLNRDSTMLVDQFDTTSRCVWVLEQPYSEDRRGHDLYEIARELERLLS